MKYALKPLTAAVALGLASSNAFAGEPIDLGGGATLDWKGTLSYVAAMRLEEPDAGSTVSGNLNFEKDDLINNGLYLLLESHLKWGDYGLVASANTFYDDVYHDDKFSSAAERYSGGYSRLLDLYAYMAKPVGDEGYLDLRVGQHVVSWGEGLFFPSISLAQGPSDAVKAVVPGTEVKDILLPEAQVSAQYEVNSELSFLAHWQFHFEETLVSSPGTFFSASDLVGNGAGERSEVKPSDTGQWGIGTRYRVTPLSEIGFYYLDYSSRLPAPNFDAAFNRDIVYLGDIDLYGLTYSTTLGMASVAAEVSYKDGAPVYSSIASFGNLTRGEVLQSNLNAIVNFGRSPLAEAVNLTVEAAYVDIMDYDDQTAIDGMPVQDLLWTSYGFALGSSLTLSYPSFSESWSLSVPIGLSNQVKGRTLTGGLSTSGGEGDTRFNIRPQITHNRTGVQLALGYTGYYGKNEAGDPGYKVRPLTDRDNLSFTAKYAF